jgi:hypothetical protein
MKGEQATVYQMRASSTKDIAMILPGFAVFKLRPNVVVEHPMAFLFDSMFPGQAFFPTVHVHDGKVHKSATFDHALYLQRVPPPESDGWESSWDEAATKVNVNAARPLVQGSIEVWRRLITGRATNADTWA